MVTKEEQEIDITLHSIAHNIDSTLVNPTNAEQVKRSYSKENPLFEYPSIPDFSHERKQLKDLQFGDTVASQLLKEKALYLKKKIALVETVGTDKFYSASKKLHPLPPKKLVNYAWEVLEARRNSKSKKVRLMDAYRELQGTFDELQLPWRVQKMNMVASASVMPSQRMLYLKRKMLFSRRFIDRLKIHEIGTHAIRAENGRLQPLKIFLHGLANYLPTEEGLAVFNEERFGLLDNTVLRTYAGRTIAVDMARKCSFVEIVEQLKSQLPERRAVTIALRAKRGVSDAESPGGFTKDSAYLSGYLALKEYEEKGGDFTPLYLGKVGLQHLPLLENVNWLAKPKYYPDQIAQHLKS